MFSAQQNIANTRIIQRGSTLNNISEPLFESYDDLVDPSHKLQVRRLISSKEKILYSGAVQKINKRLIPQNRILVVTDKALYNIQPKEDFFVSIAFTISPGSAIKRKIDIKKIFALTLSVQASSGHQQFIIHVNGEYDYRYDAGTKCEKIIKSIMNSYFLNYKVPFILYLRDESDLASYHTTDDDVKAKIDKRPKDEKIFVTAEMISRGLDFIVTNRKDFIQHTNMFYSLPLVSNNLPPQQVRQMASSNGIVPSQGFVPASNVPEPRNNSNRAQSLDSNPVLGFNIPSNQPYQVNGANNIYSQNQPYIAPNNVNFAGQQNGIQPFRNQDQAQQFDFVQKDLVTATTNYNVQITTNFDDMLAQNRTQQPQKGPYFK